MDIDDLEKFTIENSKQIASLIEIVRQHEEISRRQQKSIDELYIITKFQSEQINSIIEKNKIMNAEARDRKQWSERKMVAIFSLIGAVLVAASAIAVHFL
ncbi:MAG: hypothetical protein OWS74_09480 [Firmicutes bacterium]|nr:hypothetical protein [Bacillota bacterium]